MRNRNKKKKQVMFERCRNDVVLFKYALAFRLKCKVVYFLWPLGELTQLITTEVDMSVDVHIRTVHVFLVPFSYSEHVLIFCPPPCSSGREISDETFHLGV